VQTHIGWVSFLENYLYKNVPSFFQIRIFTHLTSYFVMPILLQNGGGLYLLDSDVVVSSSIFSGNTAKLGGGMAINKGTQVSLIGLTTFFSNAAVYEGHDMYLSADDDDDGGGGEMLNTVVCAGNHILFCGGIDNTTIYEGTINGTNCWTTGLDGSSSSNERCFLNLD
jgi:hypothetical protein